MKQWKQKIACLLAGIMVITGFFPWNSPVSVHAEESLIKSSADGFEYRLKVYESGIKEYICTSDTTQVYDNYQDAIKGLADISRKILTERKAESFSIKIPVEIKAEQKVSDIENGSNPFNDAVRDETYKETGNPEAGNGLKQFLYARGNLLNDKLDKIVYDENTKSYKGVFYYHALSYKVSNERYREAIQIADEVLKEMDLESKSEYDKVKTIMAWISANVKYDEHYYGKPNQEAKTEYPYDITGALIDHYGVCQAYANLFFYFVTAAGMNVLYESGDSHAWNLVEVDGKYYYIDPTNTHFVNGEPVREFLYGQNYMFINYKPTENVIEQKYTNISKDDYLKDHSSCHGNHDLNMDAPSHSGARCGIMGYDGYKCKNCNYVYREWIPALEHIWDEGTITQKQDCTHPEITTYKCTRKDVWGPNGFCDGKKQIETKPSLGGHKWRAGAITKEPTCTVNGEQQYTCTVCNQTKTEPVKATGHDYEIKVINAATCTSNGIARYICKTCGYAENHTITATGHNPEIRNKKEATCSSTGYTGDTYCSVCNKKLSSGKTIAKTSHTWVKQDNIPATCEKGELEVEKCSVCGDTKETEISDPLGHDYGEWVVIKKPTCTKYGLNKRYCKRCNDFEVDTPEPTGHQHTKIIDQKPATCEEKGYTGDVYCEDCRVIIQDGKEIAATGHDWDDGKITKEPTQTATGIKTYTCKTCKKTKEETIPMLKGHHWDQGTITKQPTCTEQGEKTYKCTDEDCNETYTESIPATGHKNTKVLNQKNATCESEGYTGDTYCDDCKQIIKAGKTISPTGHTWNDGMVKKAATCESEGIEVYICKTCKKTKEETIAPTGHTKTEIRDKKIAMCKEEGYTGDTYCVTCGKKLAVGKMIAKTDHDWTITEIPATCEQDGVRTYTCDICHTTKSEPIKAIGHSYGAWTTTKEATVSSKAEHKRTCSTCGKDEITTYGEKLRPTISTNATSLKLKKKQTTKKFTVTGLAKGDYITFWTSSNKKIVIVIGNQNGTCKIKAGSKIGKATITIKLASGLTKQIKVTVQKKAVTCTRIKNVPKTINLKKKQTYQLKPMIEPITCADKAKYKSSNKKTAKVTTSGKLTAVKKGKTKVTVVVGKKKFACTVNVR